jgi:hypothetical protein
MIDFWVEHGENMVAGDFFADGLVRAKVGRNSHHMFW